MSVDREYRIRISMVADSAAATETRRSLSALKGEINDGLNPALEGWVQQMAKADAEHGKMHISHRETIKLLKLIGPEAAHAGHALMMMVSSPELAGFAMLAMMIAKTMGEYERFKEAMAAQVDLSGLNKLLATLGPEGMWKALMEGSAALDEFYNKLRQAAGAQVGFRDQTMRAVVPDGLVGYWPLDARGSVNKKSIDFAGANPGYWSNSPSLENGIINQATVFSGTNYVKCTDTGLPTGASPSSVACWFKTASTNNNYQYFLAYGKEEFYYKECALFLKYNKVGFDAYGINYFSKTINPNEWHFVCQTYDSAKGSLYLDAQYQTNLTYTAAITLTGYMSIGTAISKYGNSTYSFAGSMCELRIYNRTLTTNEIQQLYLAGH